MEWIEIAKDIHIANLLCMGAMFWFGYSRLCKKVDDVEKKLGTRIDKLQETVTDIDRRLCRLEGAFQAKECCLLKSDSQHKAVE
jgi:hypothetical protein